MKHILNDLSSEERNSILEQHQGGIKIKTENFSKLVNNKLGNSKPFLSEQETPNPNTGIDLFAKECLDDKGTYKMLNLIIDQAKKETDPETLVFTVLKNMMPKSPYYENIQREIRMLDNCVGMKGVNESSLQEQDEKLSLCNPDELEKVLSILESSRRFTIKLSEKNPNYVLVKDAEDKGSCHVKRKDIFKI